LAISNFNQKKDTAMQNLIEKFLGTLRAPGTRKAYKSHLADFLRFLAGKPLPQVGEGDIQDWYTGMLEKHGENSNSPFYKWMAAKTFFEFLMNSRQIEKNPFAGLAAPKMRTITHPRVPEKVVDAMFCLAEQESLAGNAGFVQLLTGAILALLDIGPRRGKEHYNGILGLTLPDVNLASGEFTIRQKGGNSHTFPIWPRHLEMLRRYAAVRRQFHVEGDPFLVYPRDEEIDWYIPLNEYFFSKLFNAIRDRVMPVVLDFPALEKSLPPALIARLQPLRGIPEFRNAAALMEILAAMGVVGEDRESVLAHAAPACGFNITPHDFRHAGATAMAEDGMDPFAIANHFGTSGAWAWRYVSPARNAAAQFHPRAR